MLNSILPNKEIARQEYITLTSYYEQICETREPPCTERYARCVR